jgi:hypothetical protein
MGCSAPPLKVVVVNFIIIMSTKDATLFCMNNRCNLDRVMKGSKHHYMKSSYEYYHMNESRGRGVILRRYPWMNCRAQRCDGGRATSSEIICRERRVRRGGESDERARVRAAGQQAL